MSAKGRLHSVKERKSEVPVENDLRGLGSDPILKKAQPYAVLFLVNVKDVHSIEHMKKEFALESISSEDFVLNGMGLTVQNHAQRNIKEQCIILFSCALQLSKLRSVENIALTTVSGLHKAMEESFVPRSNWQHSEYTHSLTSYAHSPTGLTLSPQASLFLHQAGYPLEHLEASQTMTHQQAHDFLGKIIEESTKQKQKKAA